MALVPILLSQMGESVTEGTITKWLKQKGEQVAREEMLYNISTDKVDTEIPSPVAGILEEIVIPEGGVAKVGAVIAQIRTSSENASQALTASVPPPEVKIPQVSKNPEATPLDNRARVLASPLARHMAKQFGANLNHIPGTGAGGRIMKNDVNAHLKSKEENLLPASRQPTAVSQRELAPNTREERVPMTLMRKKIAEHMVLSKHTSAHVTSVVEVNVQKIVDARKKFADDFERANGFKLSYTPFLLTAAIAGLKAVPIMNSSIDGSDIVYKKDINLGVAVALESGLIVPVLKRAQDLNFVGIARALNDLANRARSKKLVPDDVSGGTFSLTNYGVFGTLIGQPIINQPQVGIMGVGTFEKRPVVINDAIAIRSMCYIVASYDHRVIDGADGGRFLAAVKAYLENWNDNIL